MTPNAQDQPRGDGRIWIVVGGGDAGGIVVRRGRELDSQRLHFRLETGTKIEEIEVKCNRLHYKRIRGDGPDWGWVSITHKGKPLVELEDGTGTDEPAGGEPCMWRVVGGVKTLGVPVQREMVQQSGSVTTGRLVRGALVRQVQLRGWRLQYELVMGIGPDTGWVSIETPNNRDNLVEVHAGPTGCYRPQVLDDDADGWDARERHLYFDSGGCFDPVTTAGWRRGCGGDGAGAPGRVSVVVPTTESRRPFHPQLVACFDAQTWPSTELIVVETYHGEPSTFLAERSREDDRILYVPIKTPPGRKLSIGLKRNMCTHLASGRHIAHFDDDDVYSPDYIGSMLSAMECARGEAVTLSTWYVFDCRTCQIGHVDPHELFGKVDTAQRDSWVYGYGFSYVYTRAVSLAIPFNNMDIGEDWEFLNAIRKRAKEVDALLRRGPCGVATLDDCRGICMHVMHNGNTASNWASRLVPRAEAAVLEVAQLKDVFAALTGICPRTHSVSEASPPERARVRLVQVRLSFGGCVTLAIPLGATAADVLRELAKVLAPRHAEKMHLRYASDGPPIRTDEHIALGANQLWCVCTPKGADLPGE